MRMRKRPNLLPRLERCAEYIVEDPASLRGRWLENFPGYEKLHIELGCGKGRFTVETAAAHPEIFFVAVEKVPDAMIVALERVRDRGLANVRFVSGDAAWLPELFAPGEAERLYINFCDPWPKSRDAKYRLTAPGFLRLYASVLPIGGQIHFKTDNAPLFDWSIGQFTAEGWALEKVTHDLHGSGPQGVMTDYELKFYEQGVKINRLEASRTEKTADLRAGEPPRLRNASLTDARGYAQSQRDNTEGEKP